MEDNETEKSWNDNSPADVESDVLTGDVAQEGVDTELISGKVERSKFPRLSKKVVVGVVLGILVVLVGVGAMYAWQQRQRGGEREQEAREVEEVSATPMSDPDGFGESGPIVESRPTPSPSPSSSPTPVASPTPKPRSKSTGGVRTVNVVNVAYFPERDGRLDTVSAIQDQYGEYNMSIVEVRNKVWDLIPGVMGVLSEGSAFHKYSNSGARSYLGYNEVTYIEHLEAVPLGSKEYNGLPLPDYKAMMERIGVCDLVENQGVREVWLWTYGGVGKSGWESNFSSEVGDISNSDRDTGDLPRCGKSYTVYDYNYGRGVSEAVEDHMHQYEALFKHIGYDLFWNKFVGYFPGGNWSQSGTGDTRRRCGWAHFTPNSSKDYDWSNKTSVETDCENWNPDGYGQASSLSCDRWGCSSVGYFTWWMQSVPGENNLYSYQGKKLSNWWDLVVDFDGTRERGFYQ